MDPISQAAFGASLSQSFATRSKQMSALVIGALAGWDKEIMTGSSIHKLDVKRDFPWLPADSQQAKDIERFRWFSDDFLAVSAHDESLISDVRYSFLPNRINSMWGIKIKQRFPDDGNFDAHVLYQMKNSLDKKTREQFLDMLF
jgi:inner membrane protein